MTLTSPNCRGRGGGFTSKLLWHLCASLHTGPGFESRFELKFSLEILMSGGISGGMCASLVEITPGVPVL